MTTPAGPPPGVAGAPVGAAAVAAAALAGVEVVSLPDLLIARLTAAARGLVISGTVAGREGNLVQLRTAAGEIVLRTAEPLPVGRLATLQIPPRPAEAPPAATTARLWLPQAPAPPVAPPIPAAPAGPLPAAGPPAAPMPLPAAGPAQALPTVPPAAVTAPALTGTSALPPDNIAPPPAGSLLRPVAPAPSSILPSPPGLPAPPVPSATPPATAAALPSMPPAVGSGPVPAAPATSIARPAPAIGSPGPAMAVPLGEAPDTPLERPALRPSAVGEMMALLARTEPEAARSAAEALPRTGERLAAAVLQLIGALPALPDDAFPGRAALAAMGRAGAEDLPARLAADLAPAAMRSADPAPADWRVFTLPILADDRLAAFRLAVRRREAEGRGGGAAPQPQRFLIDLDLSRLGPLQLDGLVRKPRFDLLLRAIRPLPAPIRAEIIGVFEDACAGCGLDGTLSFRFGGRGWVRLMGRNGEAVTV